MEPQARTEATAKKKRGHNNLRSRFVLLFVLVQALLVACICLSNIDSIRFVNQQTLQANVDILAMYTMQLDQRFYETRNYLLMLHTNESGIVEIQSPHQHVRQIAYVQLISKLQKDISLYPSVDMLFLYNQLDAYSLSVYGKDSQYEDRVAQKAAFLDALAQGQVALNQWVCQPINGRWFLMQVVERSGVYIGAWLRCDTLIAPLQSAMGALVNDRGQVLTNQALFGQQLTSDQQTLRQGGKHYRVVATTAAQAPVRACMAVPSQGFWEHMSSMQWLTFIGSLLAIAGVPLLLWLIYRQIIKPLGILQSAMRHIGAGEQDYRITEENVPDEFLAVNHAFNDMTEELKTLKIRSYEEVIERQRLALACYQMQIKPHFFINALTSIVNLRRLGRQEDMERFVYHLSQHVRYMMQPGFTFVTVKEELDQIDNFLLMQNIRCGEFFSCVKACDKEAESVRIPPFVIYTFAENVVRHASRKESVVTLFLEVRMQAAEGAQRLHIVIEDNGEGLTDEAIARIGAFAPPVRGRHIGLWNTRQTLALVYHGDYRLSIGRSEMGGLKAELLLPCHTG